MGSQDAPARIPPGLVTAVDHVGIAVADLDEAIAWYGSTFGLVATHTETNEEQGVREAMLSAPGDDGGPAVQLLAPLNENSTIAKFIGRNGPGIQQMAYRVQDIDKTCEHLRSRGVRLLYDAPRRGTAGSRINFVHPKDGGGVLIELVQPAASGSH
jgi:methylmalonyl-CoA/ethylmalonyl-CoA epimerase